MGLGAVFSSSFRWSLWIRPQVRSWTHGWCDTLTHLYVCRCPERTVFFSDSYAMSPLAHNAPIFIPKVSLEFLCLSRAAHSHNYLLLPRCHCCHPQGLSPLNCLSYQANHLDPRMQRALPSPCLYVSMKQGRALAFAHPMNDCRFHVTTRIHVIRGFLHSTHHSAKAVSIWWEKPEYYSILLEFSRAIPQTLWRRWIFNFFLRLGREYRGEDIPGQGGLAWWLRKANQEHSERSHLRHLEYLS